jgi:hypothetical protein
MPPALTYIRRLFDPNDHVFFQLLNSKTRVTEVLPLLPVREVSERTIQQLEDFQSQGFDIYISMAPFPTGTTARREMYVEQVRSVFIDADVDGAKILELIREAVNAGTIPPPTTVLQSSPNKFHIAWRVDGVTPAQARGLNRALAQAFGGDPAATDLHRLLRIAGFKNLKYDDQPVCTVVEAHDGPPSNFTDFQIASEPVEHRSGESIGKLDGGILRVEQNAAEAGVALRYRRTYGTGVLWNVECPWLSEHTSPGKSAAIMLLADGRLQFSCLHQHCAGRGWSDMRAHLESRVGRKLSFTPEVDPGIFRSFRRSEVA